MEGSAPVLERVDLPRFDLRTLYANLLRLAEEGGSREVFLLALLQHAAAVSNAVAGIYFVRDVDGALSLGPRLFSHAMTERAERVVEDLADAAREVAAQGVAISAPLKDHPAYTAVLTPVSPAAGQLEVLGLVLVPGNRAIEPFLSFVQLIAGFANLRDALSRGREAGWEATQSARLIELVACISDIADLEQARSALVNGMQELLGCDRAALASADPEGRVKRVHVVSGLSSFDKRSTLARAIEQALAETLALGEPMRWPHCAAEQPSRAPGHQALQAATNSGLVLSVPLATHAGVTVGGLVCWWSTLPADVPRAVRLLQASAIPIGALVELLDRRRSNKWLRGTRRRGASKGSTYRPLLALLAAALLLSALFVPVTHRVSARVVLEPTVSRVVAAPFDGILVGSEVRAGHLVSRDDVLARLDGREIRLQVAGVDAEFRAAAKRRDISMAEGDTHAAQIARLDMQRLELRKSLLNDQLGNLEIRNPIDGIVVSGDLDRKTGGPITRGQVLFEVAPLQQMLAEVAVPAEDISFVSPGMPLSLSIDGVPARRWDVVLGPIRPRAEIRHGDNYFVSEVDLDNPRRMLRPGMQGTAKIAAGRRTLGWVLFHKPWERLARWFVPGAYRGDYGG